MAISSPLLETSINGARGVLINVTGSMDIGLEEVETAANLVQEAAHPDANIIFGAAFDPDLEDEIRVTVIATGFDEAAAAAVTAEPYTEARAKVEQEVESELEFLDRRIPSPLASIATEPVPAAEPAPVEAPATEAEQPAAKEESGSVSNEDWDILQKIFSKRS